MTCKLEISEAEGQEFSAASPVLNLVAGIDSIFTERGVAAAVFRNPSGQSKEHEKVAGLTNTYLQPIRIGRKAVFGKVDFYYGRKFNVAPDVYEIVPFEAPLDIFSFVERRFNETLTDYLSIHRENFRLSLDIKNGVITSLSKIGFDEQFKDLSRNMLLTIRDLDRIIQTVLEIS